MKGKASTATRVRLSPNEEAQLVKQELDRRRKLRLQQVREQERFIAGQVRRQVQERRQEQLRTLADSLQLEWTQHHTQRLHTLHTHYELSRSAVGHAHRSTQDNEPDVEVQCQECTEQQERAERRHREALRELNLRRHQEQQQQRRHIDARRKALEEEKRRAERVSSLPPPPPNPVESIVMKTPRPLKPAEAERFSVTHCHMMQAMVDREMDIEQQPSAHQAAEVEFTRLEELQREGARDTQERLERVRLRGRHALRREQRTQDRAQLLCELERLQQADLLRRRQALVSVPVQIYQPLYRQEELREEQQRDLEIAFQDLYTEEHKDKDDMVLQLVPEPIPPLSSASHDEELDVTLDPECTSDREESHATLSNSPVEQPIREPASSAVPADSSRRALSRLLERIRSQRARSHPLTPPERAAEQEKDGIVDTGPLSSQETASTADTEDIAVLGETLLPLQDQVQQVSAHTYRHVAALLRQQEEQLALLEELEEKRRELERCLRETHQTPDQRPPGTQESIPAEPPSQDEADDVHTHRLHQYQQRLLQQNRLHQRCVEEARRRLEEYQHTLKFRDTINSAASAQQPAGIVQRGSGQRSALPFVINTDPGAAPVREAQVSVQSSGHPSVLFGAALQEVHEQEAGPAPPLPPPAVVLELLRSRQYQSAEFTGPVKTLLLKDESETDRQHMRKQRDVLTALITASTQGPVSRSVGIQHDDSQASLNTLLNIIEEANGHIKPSSEHILQDGTTPTPMALSNGVCGPAPVHHGRVKPPVSRPPARLPFFQQMEQHELSAIQEVDTPVNVSLDTESSSASLPVVSSGSPSDRSQVTGRTGRMSWRETLLQDSSLSSVTQQEEMEMRLGTVVKPDHLSSTTISTGSFSTSDQDSSFTAADASHPSSSLMSSPGHMTTARSPVQQIIEKYSQELDASLRHAGAVSSAPSWSSVLHEEEHSQQSSTDASGVFQPLQPLPDMDSSSSSSTGWAVRDNQSSRAQGWSETVSRILECLSGQLSIRQPSAAPGHPDVWAELQGHSSTTGLLNASEISQVIPTAPGMKSSQVLEESVERQESSDEPSGVFLPLPFDLTHNEAVDCSATPCVPLDAEVSTCGTEASVELSHHSLQLLRSDALQTEAELEISVDQLSLSHESLCENHTVIEVSHVTRSPLQSRVSPQLPSLEVMSSSVQENTLMELLERAQAAGDVKGILEESILSFISLPESDATHTEDTGDEPQEV